MASSSSFSFSSSSSMSRRNYGVFLSFRGPDTRHTIVSHLYNALTQKGVYVFKDNEELEAGQRRSELFHAIEGTRVALVVFSKNYARSKWCLDELQKIMECKDRGNLSVIPLFYQVSPGEVRLNPKDNAEKGCYQMAIEEMEETFGKDSEMVKRWRKVLWQGGDLKGSLARRINFLIHGLSVFLVILSSLMATQIQKRESIRNMISHSNCAAPKRRYPLRRSLA